MTEFNSHIFYPNEQINLLEERKNLIGWIFLLIIILFFVLEFFWVALSSAALVSIICYGLAIDRWNKLEKLNGSLPLRLAINEREIRIGDKAFVLNELRIEKLICYDYKGRITFSYVFLAQYPQISNGTWNHLSFIHKNKEYQFRFLINSEKHSKQLEEIKRNIGL